MCVTRKGNKWETSFVIIFIYQREEYNWMGEKISWYLLDISIILIRCCKGKRVNSVFSFFHGKRKKEKCVKIEGSGLYLQLKLLYYNKIIKYLKKKILQTENLFNSHSLLDYYYISCIFFCCCCDRTFSFTFNSSLISNNLKVFINLCLK